jgi:hypothetical protein
VRTAWPAWPLSDGVRPSLLRGLGDHPSGPVPLAEPLQYQPAWELLRLDGHTRLLGLWARGQDIGEKQSSARTRLRVSLDGRWVELACNGSLVAGLRSQRRAAVFSVRAAPLPPHQAEHGPQNNHDPDGDEPRHQSEDNADRAVFLVVGDHLIRKNEREDDFHADPTDTRCDRRGQ